MKIRKFEAAIGLYDNQAIETLDFPRQSVLEGSASSKIWRNGAPVAQLDRVLDYESSGRRFDSFRARQFFQLLSEL